MTNNNHYWQPFPTNIVDNSNLLVSQQNNSQQQQPQQHSWNDQVDKRKWTPPEFGEFSTNKMFTMDEYNNNNNNNSNSNNEPSEADSPDSGGGSSRRHDSLSDLNSGSQGDQKQRRKEQNRAAQRAFRERKEKYVKELQQKIKEMEKKHYEEMTRISNENDSLKQLVKKMEAEIYTLKGAAMAFNVSISKLREAGLEVQTAPTNPSPPQSERQSPPSSNTSKSLFDEETSFAERELNRFDHRTHPLMNSGVKMIPCSQIWERLSQHPNFDEFNLDQLCEELKKKAVCSGNGPVIPESELLAVLHQMDNHHKQRPSYK